MAITSAIMQMRRGEEEYFDPDKMHPGEWAVSTDTKYVRMCFSPGVCVRMATYEAFEEDMEQIIAILEEAKTVQEAIEKIYEEFQKAELDIEAAENSAILSESYAHGGTGTREGEDTDNAKYYAESVSGAVGDIALNRQTLGYVKKNLLKNTATTTTKRGITFTVNDDGSVTVNGTATANAYFEMDVNFVPIQNGKYILSGCPSGGSSTTFYLAIYDNTILNTIVKEVGLSKDVELDITHTYKPIIYVLSGTTVENLTFYPMIRSADITDATYEPYVDDVNTRLKALTPVNNLIATVPGSPLDAVMGKELKDEIDEVNSALSDVGTIFSDTTTIPVTIPAAVWTDLSPSITLPPGTYVITACARFNGAVGTATIRFKHEVYVRGSVSSTDAGIYFDATFTHIQKCTEETPINITAYCTAEFGSTYSSVRAIRIK